MTALTDQARENAYAEANNAGIPGVLTRCLKAGMSLTEARKVVQASKDKQNPWSWGNKLIACWRAEKGQT